MTLSRRGFVAGTAGGVALAALPRRGQVKLAHAEGSDRPDTLITFFLSGGVDQLLTTDPKLRSEVTDRVHLPYEEDDILTIGNTRVGPFLKPLRQVVPRLAIVNGVVSGTVAHPTGMRNIVQMRRTYPAFDRVGLGGHLARALPSRVLEQVHFLNLPTTNEVHARPSGRVLVVNQLSNTELRLRLQSDQTLLSVLNEIAQSENQTAYTAVLEDACRGCPQKVVRSLLKAMQGRVMAGPEDIPFSADFRDIVRLSTSFAPVSYEELAEFWHNAAVWRWRGVVRDILYLVEHKLTRSIYVDATADWDSHDLNDSRQIRAMSTFAPMLNFLVKQLDERSLSGRVGIVLTSELGRHPFLNRGLGKDHFPEHPVMFLGPGIRHGQYGQTDRETVALPVSLRTGRPSKQGRKITLDDVGASILDWFGVAEPRRLGYIGEPLRFLRKA